MSLVSRTLTLLFLCCLSYFKSYAQIGLTNLDSWINSAPFFDIEKRDSVLIWAQQMEKLSSSPRAQAYAIRLKGLHEEFEENIPEATAYFLDFLEQTKVYNNKSDEMSATGDLVYIYITTKQYSKAKNLLLAFTNHPEIEKLNQRKLSIFYNNLGICYNNLNQADSAVYMYAKALKVKEALNDLEGMANLRINMSNLLIKQGRYKEAQRLTQANLNYLESVGNSQDLWFNLGNMGGIFNGLKQTTQAESYLLQALAHAKQENNKDHQQKSYDLLAKFYHERNLSSKAYNYLRESNRISNLIINENTNEKIAELSEAYKAKEKELENNLLSSQLMVAHNRQNMFLVGIIGLLLLTAITFYFYFKNKEKNKLISAQNHTLQKLNEEKNELMAIVSHDLSSPFTAIKVWSESSFKDKTIDDYHSILEKINHTALNGLASIRRILTIDKNELNSLDIQKVDLSDVIREVYSEFKPIAQEKGIEIDVDIEQNREHIVSDKKLLARALNNLISNAIKYSPKESTIKIRTYEQNEALHFEVKDYGVGIAENKQKDLFEKYTNNQSQVTHQESSHGLGLHIVKRIAEELGGEISFISIEGTGSTFTFSLPI